MCTRLSSTPQIMIKYIWHQKKVKELHISSDIHSSTFKDLNRTAIHFALTCFMVIIKRYVFRDWKVMVLWTPGSSLHYLHSSEIISLSSLISSSHPYLCPHLKQSSRFCKGNEKKNKLNESILHKGHKMNRFQPWIVSKWMIIWLISEINNNNCLSLLIRALNSKWNSSAELWAGFTAQDSEFWVEEKQKRDDPAVRCPHTSPSKVPIRERK